MRPRGRAPAGSGCTRPAATCSRTCWRCRRRTCARPALALAVRGGAVSDSMRITWLMRTTLHLVHAARPRVAAPAVRAAPGGDATCGGCGSSGVSEEQADRAVELIAERVPGQAPRARRAPRRRTASRSRARRSPTSCTAPRCGAASRSRPSASSSPLALPAPGDRDAALDELARRYCACHAGATADDLAYWSGLPARDVRAPAAHAVDDGPVPRVAAPGLRRAPARLARPHADRPRGARQAGPPGRRHPARGDPRGRRRRGHVDRAR